MASNTIKGLTVEIGGDTTKLGKAIKEAESQSRRLSKELTDINGLLKFDPGNAELLAQKQKVLTDAIAASADKLDTLKEAEKQVQAQFKKGEVSEEQVRALQREIVATENKMKGYKKQADGVADALKKMGADSDDTAQGVKDVGKEVGDTGDEAKKSAKKVDDFADSAEKADKSSGGLGSTLASAAKTGLKAVGVAAGAAITGLVAAAESSREYRVAMGKLDTAFTKNGFTAEQAKTAYTELVGVLGETDQSVEAANHLAQLTDNEKDLATWTGDILPGMFATFGDSLPLEGLTEAANETAKVGQVTGPMADALNWATLSTEEWSTALGGNSKAQKAFNRAMKRGMSAEDAFNEALKKCSTEQERQALITATLSSVYGEASAAYKETNAEVIRANQANDAWMQSMAGVGAAVEPIITDVKMMGASLLSEAVPGVQALAEAFRGMMSGEEGSAAGFGEALGGLLDGLLAKLTEMVPMVLEVGTTLVTTLITSLAEQLPMVVDAIVQVVPQIITALLGLLPTLLTSLMGMTTSIITGLAGMLPSVVQAIVQVVPQLITALLENLPALLQAAITLFMALVDALPTVITQLVAALPGIISAVVNFVTANLPTLLQAAVTLFMALVNALPEVISALAAALPQIINTLTQFFVDNIDVILQAAITLLMALVDAIPQIIDALAAALPDIITAILQAVITATPQLLAAAIELFWALVTAAGELLAELPTHLKKIGQAIMDGIEGAVPGVTQKALDIFNAIWGTIKGLPDKMLEVGGDLVTGLWNGINNMTDWVIGKINGFSDSVLGGIKKFFGIASPSKEMMKVGKFLDQGLTEGILDNMAEPVKAAQKMASSVMGASEIDGPALERSLQMSNNAQAAMVEAQSSGAMMDKLDKILSAIEKGQVIALDGKKLIGGTVSRYDSALGQRQILAARGAI